MQPGRMPDRALLWLIGVTGLVIAWLRCQSMLFDYPYMFPDSFDWLANGLQYSGVLGEWQQISHRGMLLTLIYALLYKLDATNLIPSIGTLSHTLLAGYVLWVPTREFSARVRFLAALFIILSYMLLGQSAYVGADSLANLLVSVSALLLIQFAREPNPTLLYYLAVIGALGAHSQNIFPILLPTFLFAGLLGVVRSSRAKFRRALSSPHALWSCLLFALIVLSLFVPRLVYYKVFYEERVQHTSLIKFDVGGIRYYAEAFLASFSPIICGLSVFGAYRALRRGSGHQDTGFFLVTWALNIFMFFALLYSWRDVRFWIYGSTPIYLLAALGLDDILAKIRPRPFRQIIISLCAVSAHCTPSIDPWDTLTTLTPTLALDFGGSSEGYIRKLYSKPYIYEHIKELRSARYQSATTGFSSIMRDSALLHSLQNARHRIDSKPLGVFAPLGPSEYYIANNRNTVYASYHVKTLRTFSDVREFAKNNASLVIPEEKLNELRVILAGYAHMQRIERLGKDTSRYVLVDLMAAKQVAVVESSPLSKITSIEGAVDGHKIADGIWNSSENFATIPLGNVMAINFGSPQDIKSLIVHLWDGDARAYMFQIAVIEANGHRRSLSGIEKAHQGIVVLDCNCKGVESLEVTGQFNSSVEWIPGNNFLHIKEIEFT